MREQTVKEIFFPTAVKTRQEKGEQGFLIGARKTPREKRR